MAKYLEKKLEHISGDSEDALPVVRTFDKDNDVIYIHAMAPTKAALLKGNSFFQHENKVV